MPVTKIIVGFFVGLLCGVIPLVYGLISRKRAFAFGGIAASAFAGVLFNLLNKSPFSAIVVAILFLFIIIASNKHREKLEQDDSDLTDNNNDNSDDTK